MAFVNHYNNISFFTCSISAHPEQTHDVYVINEDAPQIYYHGGHDNSDDPVVQDDSATYMSDEHIL